MKNFNILSFRLMMMVVMVHGASTLTEENQIRLKQIKQEATEMLKKFSKDDKKLLVPDITESQTECMHHFFCLVEKSLKTKLNLTKLYHFVKSYNQQNKNVTTCHLNMDTESYIETLLKKIIKCSNQIKKPSP